MTNDLKTQIEYFLDLQRKITQGEWFIQNDQIYVAKMGCGCCPPDEPTPDDFEAISKLPQALDLIAELSKKKTEEFEYQYRAYENKIVWRLNNRVEDLRKSVNNLRKNNVALKEENAELKKRIQELGRDQEEKLAKEARISEDLEFLYSIDPNAY